MCLCLCVVLQMFQGIPELLHPRARLHLKDIFTADQDAPHRPPGEGTPRVRPLSHAHAQLHPRVLAASQPRFFTSIESSLCWCPRPRCQTQTDPGGSLQGIKTEKQQRELNVYRKEKERRAGRRSPIKKQILLMVEKSECKMAQWES